MEPTEKGRLMGRAIRSPRARQDLLNLNIGRYIAQDNRDAALRFLAKIDDAIDLLSRFPGSGQAREDLGKGFAAFQWATMSSSIRKFRMAY